MRATPCTDHVGREYPSLAARARAYGLSRQLVNIRLAMGMGLGDALTTPPKTAAVPTAIDGTAYASRHEAARALGLTPEGARYRALSATQRSERHRVEVETRGRHARWRAVEAILDTWRAVTGRARRAREVAA